MKRICTLILMLASCAAVNAAYAAACEEKAYNDFDFWLGEWDVTTPDGKKAGVNSIQKNFNNCVVTESYETKDGPYGTSLNIYDKTTDNWYQTWVDKTGLRLQLSGGMQNESMILSGETKNKEGNTIEHKISWTPQQNGSVIQHWEMRQADAKSWQTLFKGIYKKQS